MNKTLGLKIVLVAAVIVGVGLVCRCKAQDRDQQVFNVVETEDISTTKLVRKLKNNEDTPSTPRRVAELLARTINKSKASLEVGGTNFTIRELLDLNMFDSKNITDCTITEIERRQEVCNQLQTFLQLKSYCDRCVEYLTDYCRKFPYLRTLEASVLKFDWRPHGQVFLFSQNITTYIMIDGNEESSVKTNVASYLDTKDSKYRQELKAHCKSFEKDLKSKLYHFGSSSDKTIEMVKDIDEDMYNVWERCQAVEEETQRRSTTRCYHGYRSYGC